VDEKREVLLEADSDRNSTQIVEAWIETVEQFLVGAEVGWTEVLPTRGRGFRERFEGPKIRLALRRGGCRDEQGQKDGI
jgi:hypothetical protein